MNVREHPLLLTCGDDELVGIVSMPHVLEARTGVLIVTGGPQYRAGSHRQFVLLARALAAAGVACMRFDYRGMGDASGAPRAFDAVDDDVRSAISGFLAAVPELERVVLWALCDGASAACLYAPSDPRVAGVMLLNPWVRTAEGEARTILEHHYGARLRDARAWRRLFSGRVNVLAAARSLVGAGLALLRGGTRRAHLDEAADAALPQRMAARLADARVPFAVGLSGRDYVALEFEQVLARSEAWQALARGTRCIGIDRFPAADHTFSSSAWQNALLAASRRWLDVLDQRIAEGNSS